MSKIILTDIDDCLISWRKGFLRFMEKHGFEVPDINDIDAIDLWMNSVPEIRANGWIETFNDSNDFGHLEPFQDALDVVPELHGMGWQFICISMVGKDYNTKMNRYENLQRHFPNMIESIIHTPFVHGAKRKYLDWFKPTYWVEDNTNNAIDGANAGHTPFLIERYPSSTTDSRIIKVKDWHGILERINNDNS